MSIDLFVSLSGGPTKVYLLFNKLKLGGYQTSGNQNQDIPKQAFSNFSSSILLRRRSVYNYSNIWEWVYDRPAHSEDWALTSSGDMTHDENISWEDQQVRLQNIGIIKSFPDKCFITFRIFYSINSLSGHLCVVQTIRSKMSSNVINPHLSV